MTRLLAQLRRVRERAVQRALAEVEFRRRALDDARAALARHEQLLEALDTQAQWLSIWLGEEASDPTLRMSALARVDALISRRQAAAQAARAGAAAVSEADARLRTARRGLGRANARLSGVEVLERAAASAAQRRRDRLGELDQEHRRSGASTDGWDRG